MSYGGYEYSERGFGGGFDATGGFGGYGMDTGGGFMADDKVANQTSGQKSRDRQSLLPLTVKQILGARSQDDVYYVDDAELHMVKLVGTVTSPQEHSTNLTFRINDGTGTIECKQWIEKEAASYNKIKGLKDGMTVKVVGNLREYEGKLHVLVYDFTPIVDWNEVTHHILEVILTHCKNTKGPIPGSTSAPGASSGTPGYNRGMMGAPSGAPAAGMNLNATLKQESQGLLEKIFNIYQEGLSAPQGLSYQQAFTSLRTRNVNITMDQLMRAVAQLCEDGRLYTTIDDEHYRPTSSDFY